MLLLPLTACFAVFLVTDAVPTPNSKEGGPIGELPENWDQTKDDTQSLFLNKSDKNDLEPYPLALSEEGNPDDYERGMEQRFDPAPELDNLIMRPELYGEPPAMEGLSAGYDSRRRKRGSGTKVGGAGAATKVATKSGKKNLKAQDHEAPSPVDSVSQDHDARRKKRGSGTKVGGAAASAKTATKNSGGKKNFRPQNIERRKRDSGQSAADVRALLNLWEAQERRKQEYANQWASDRYYGRMSPEDDQAEVDENGDIWYNEPVVVGPPPSAARDYPHHSYFSEQNRMALARGYPEAVYQVDPNELAQRYEEARRKRNYANKVKRFMVARKRSDSPMQQNSYRPRNDLYTLAELLRSAPRVQEEEVPVYRRLVL